MMAFVHKIWNFFKTKFLTKKFLTFGIIGVINTAIHMTIYYAMYNLMALGPFLSNTAAFITASTFSYYSNAIFTFKPNNKSTMQFGAVMMVFLVRLLTSNFLTWGFDYAIQNWVGIDYAVHTWTTIIAPFIASALLIPIAYFALEYVFKATDGQKTTEIK
jgi:putative flippase GtrA